MSWLLRFIVHLKIRNASTGPLTLSELTDAERLILTHVQCTSFLDEINDLKQGKSVSKTSDIARHDPMLHGGMVVVGGRLRHSDMHFSEKHPIILPYDHQVSRLIVADSHNLAHLGVEWTLSHVRRKYWIAKARNMIKTAKRACVVCKRLYAQPPVQKMADLPPERCEPYKPPWSYVGIDIFGNFYVKCGRSECKRYILRMYCVQYILRSLSHLKPMLS